MAKWYQCWDCDWLGTDPGERFIAYYDDAYGARQKCHERVLMCPECGCDDPEELDDDAVDYLDTDAGEWREVPR